MNGKHLLWIPVLLISVPVGFAQSEIAGKWQTEQAAALQSRGAPSAQGNRQIRLTNSAAVVLDLRVEGNTLTGTAHEIGGGDPMTINEGTINGKTFTFQTDWPLARGALRLIWKGELTNDKTLSVTRRTQTDSGGLAEGARGKGGFVGGAPVDPAPRSAQPPPLIFHRAP